MDRKEKAKTRRRELRQSANSIEKAVWTRLRNRRLGGFKFRRQHSVNSYFVDYYCVEAGLIVELDGSSHEFKEEYDAFRQSKLEAHGYYVLRFRNHEVDENFEGFLERVLETCRKLSSKNKTSSPARLRGGEVR